MQIISGKSVVDQVVAGKLCFCHRHRPAVPVLSRLSWQEEEKRFRQVQQKAVLELAVLYDRAFARVGTHTASIFATHAMLVEDGDLTASVLTLLRNKSYTAEYAVKETVERYAAQFAAMEDEYMRFRVSDIRDIARRLICSLMGIRWDVSLEESSILVADEFLPSEIMELEGKVLGMIARRSSVDSHSAMLAQAYRIPTIVEAQIGSEWEGHLAVLDGQQGRVYLDPDRFTLERLCSDNKMIGATFF